MRPMLCEVMDSRSTPASLRHVLQEVLETCNSRPFRTYNDWVVRSIVDLARQRGYREIVELGAGTAPLCRRLLRSALPQDVALVTADLYPDADAFRRLASESAGRVRPRYDAVDFSAPQAWPKTALLVLSSTFHHLPHALRMRTLRRFAEEDVDFVVVESIRRHPLAFLACLLGWVPALLTPLTRWRRRGRLRRIFWCWLVPVAGLCFMWDGLVTCWRCWTEAEWTQVLSELWPGDGTRFRLEDRALSLMVIGGPDQRRLKEVS